MASYKDPSFQDRTASAQQAREKALKLLAAKKAPVMDEAEVARRKAAREAKEAAEAEKRAAKKAAIEQAKAEKKAAAMVPEVAKPTDEELKAARDAKYAARKNRKK